MNMNSHIDVTLTYYRQLTTLYHITSLSYNICKMYTFHYHWKPKVVMMATVLSLELTQVVRLWRHGDSRCSLKWFVYFAVAAFTKQQYTLAQRPYCRSDVGPTLVQLSLLSGFRLTQIHVMKITPNDISVKFVQLTNLWYVFLSPTLGNNSSCIIY